MDDFDPDQYIASFDPDQYLSSQSDSGPASQSAEFDPDQYIASFDPDKYLAGQDKPEAEGALGTFGREAAHAAVPAATGILTGAATGALTGAALGTMGAGPIGTMVGGFIGGAAGMLGGSMVGEYAQDSLVNKVLGYDDAPQRAANKEAHGVASFMGGVAPFLGNPVLAAEKGAGALAQVTGKNLAQRAVGSGMMTAFEGGQQLYQGEFHPGELAGNAAVGFAMPAGNRFTRAIHGAGEGIAERYIPGRPDTVGPNAEADKADAAASQTPNTTAGDATAQPPAADPKGAVGYENSKAQGPTDGTKKKSTPDEVFGDTGKKGFSQGDKSTDPTIQAAMGSQATILPAANVGRVVETGIPTAQGPQQASAFRNSIETPPVHPGVQAAMDRNAQILREYNGKRQPTEIKKEFENNRRVIFAQRGPKNAPTEATLLPEAPKAAPAAPEQAAMAAKHGENSYLAKPAEPVTPSQATLLPEAPKPIAEATPPEQRVHREAPVKPAPEPVRTTDIEEITPQEAAAMRAKREARANKAAPTEATLLPEAPAVEAKPTYNASGERTDVGPVADKINATKAQIAKLQERIAANPTDLGYKKAAPTEATLLPEKLDAHDAERELNKRFAKEDEPNLDDMLGAGWRDKANPADNYETQAGKALEAKLTAQKQPLIVVKPEPNKRLAREDGAMLAKLREMGWNETADRLQKTPEAQRPALRKQIAEALPRERSKEKSDLNNKIGKQANSPADRDRQNSAIDAIQKAFDEHAPKDNETAQELVDRLKAAVDTAQTAHGDNPLHAKKGYRPQKLPSTFNWMRKVQDAAVKRKEYWTQDKIDAFKSDENVTREANAEYPVQDPRLMDASIAKAVETSGAVADRELLNKGDTSHESAVLEKTSLERATRAIQELGRYMQGTVEHRELSDKAKKTLDAMPADVRKAWRDSSEKGADPALKEKVKTWLKDHFSDKPTPFAAIDTHEQETGYVKPKERQVTSRADLGRAALAEEGASTDLIKPVVEKPKAKTKEKKYDFEAKTKSGKELSPEEAARIVKASEEAQAKNKASAAPRPSYDKAGDSDKYSPLKVGIKDMLGHIVDGVKEFGENERGGLDIGNIGADFKKLFDKFAASFPPKGGKLDDNWEIKIGPTYIAKRVTSEPQQAGRNIADMLNVAGKVDNVIKVHALAGKEQAHILAATKEEQRQMYDALEKRNPDLIADPKLRDIFEHSIIPAHVETAALREWIKEAHPEVDIGRDTEDGVHRRALNGRNSELELESIGENADPTAGSSPISTTKRSPVMERQFAALEDADGNRHIVHLKLGENGKPNGEFSVWKGYKNHEMDNAPPMEFKKVNDLYKIGDRTFKMKDATTDEIHDNVHGADNKPMEYQRDAAASVYTANAYFRQLANHLQTLDRIKASREFQKYSTDKSDLKKEGWKQSEVPGFQKYWMDDHVRESLEDAYQQGFSDDALNQARNFSRAITQSIFWTPTAHAMNVSVHWGVGRGFKWLPNDLVGGRNYRDMAETGATAIRSVIQHDKIQDVLHEHGAGLIYGGIRGANATRELARGLGETIQKNPGKWEKIADKMGLPVGDLIRGVYKASSHAMWSVNDMLLTQAILEHLKAGGKTVDSASKQEIREAIAHIEKHIPNYRTPSRIISDDKLGRTIAKAMRDPLVFGFGRYRYGMFNSFANMTNSVLHGTKAERIETAGQMMVMGALAFVVYPMVMKPLAGLITGNDAAEVRPRGPVAPIGHIKDDLFGKGDLWPLIRETVSLSPLFNSAVDLLIKGKDFGGRDIMNKKDVHDAFRGDPKAMLNAGVQFGGWAAGQRYSPLSTLNSSLGNPKQGVLGGLRDAALDIKNQSDKAQKYEAQTPRRLQKETVQRNKNQPNLGDKILGGLGIN